MQPPKQAFTREFVVWETENLKGDNNYDPSWRSGATLNYYRRLSKTEHKW